MSFHTCMTFFFVEHKIRISWPFISISYSNHSNPYHIPVIRWCCVRNRLKFKLFRVNNLLQWAVNCCIQIIEVSELENQRSMIIEQIQTDFMNSINWFTETQTTILSWTTPRKARADVYFFLRIITYILTFWKSHIDHLYDASIMLVHLLTLKALALSRKDWML